jgi:hypothetical protein
MSSEIRASELSAERAISGEVGIGENASGEPAITNASLAANRSPADWRLGRPGSGVDPRPSTEVLLSAEAASLRPGAGPYGPSSEAITYRDSTLERASALGALSARAASLLADVPNDRPGRSAWLTAIAKDEEIARYLVGWLGARVAALDSAFACVLHRNCRARLTRASRKGDIVYWDESLQSARREFQTIPELFVASRTGMPQRLSRIAHALWRLRILHASGLISLPPVAVPPVAARSAQDVQAARDGFELLLR